MSRFLIILLLAIAGASNVLSKFNGRIVGGANANFEFTARIVSIQEGATSGKLCSGVVISPRRVLTVAQAIFTYDQWIVGSNNSNVIKQHNQESSIAYHHPEYNENTLANNIGIIYVIYDITQIIEIIPFPSIWVSSTFVALGYGINDLGAPSEMLQMKEFGVVPQGICLSAYNAVVVRPDNFCGSASTPGSVAAGDQGGPIINMEGDGVIGIVSFWDNSWETNNPPRPTVCVYLNDHQDFIADHTDLFGTP